MSRSAATRQSNLDRILRALAEHAEGLSRSALIEETHLSRPTVSTILDILTARGTVEAVRADPTGAAGRPAVRFQLTAPPGLVLALDIGHGHMRAAVADGTGTVLNDEPPTARLDVDAAGPSALLKAVELLVKALGKRSVADVNALGVGMPAPVSADGVVLRPGYLAAWREVVIADELRRLLSARLKRELRFRIVIDNDANLGALGEARYGAARGCDTFVYVKVSSGVGAGLFLAGRPYRGSRRIAGEFGHVSVPAEAEEALPAERMIQLPRTRCPRCRRLDCVENLCGGRALVEQVRISSGESSPQLTIEQIAESAAGDVTASPLCRQAVTQAGVRIGHALADLARIIDPEVIVVGGLLTAAGDVFLGRIRDALHQASSNGDAVRVVPVDRDRIVRSELEGAVALALESARLRALAP